MSVSDTATGVSRGYSPAEKGLHDLLGNRRGDGAAEAVRLLLEYDRDRHLRVVRGGEGREPGRVDVVDPRLRGAGLARVLDARDLRCGPRAALSDCFHHLRQLSGRLR